ncbi:sugar kinase [Pricia sp. S334]|uniref:Sugar kinase n=1 Tax=Pricia mediterranea TaxID=3076079 RepID=A0ABU3L3F4_9FLAO|nr:sugar kinase [Pricia sp. S334]MDT7827622.1 sugar kinase [Pricia sp. S334]
MSFSTFGEIMLRLVPSGQADRLRNSSLFAVDYAGSESNVAVSLACLGNDVQFITKLPDNPLGQGARQSLDRFGISTENCITGGERMGTYFIELGSSIRPSRVVYDRAGSAIATMDKGEFDWECILKNQKWLHVSGITPALSKPCAEACVLAVKTAGKMGVKVSFDLNYRRSLWDYPKKAKAIFDGILEHTDLVFGNIGVLKDVYGLVFNGNNPTDKTLDALRKARHLFGTEQLAFTVRDHSSASQNRLSGACISENNPIISNAYDIEVTDRFGTGDAFAAGFLHALEKGWHQQRCIDFATAAFALKHTMSGDIHTSDESEIDAIVAGNISGHVIR